MRGQLTWPNWNGDDEEALNIDQINTAEDLWNEFKDTEIDVTKCGNIHLEIPISRKQCILIIVTDQFHQMALYIDGVLNLEKEKIPNTRVNKTITNIRHLIEFYKWYVAGT